MDPECRQFQVSEGMKIEGLPEKEQISNKSPSCHQPGSPAVQGANGAHRSRPISGLKPDHCFDSVRATCPTPETTKDAGATTPFRSAQGRDSQTRLGASREAKASGSDGRTTEQQVNGNLVPMQRETPSLRTPLCKTPESCPPQEEQCVIPKNIQHKFRTHVLNEVLSDKEVKEFLNQKGNTAQRRQKTIIDELNMYEKIGFLLRSNIFPGFSGGWKSEAQSTYTKEVVDCFKRDPEQWHGRTSDDLGAWTDTLMAHERWSRHLQRYIGKQLKLRRTGSKACDLVAIAEPGHPKAQKKVAAKLPTGRVKLQADGTIKKDEKFWEFYNQSLPPL
ncbi:ciliary microtubule inner protein 4 isoform X2 [Narcine bancroftii]|uniref:ciliary microtubule inner protein 4 isoform X2 n=1 Tax=Narcine bancroftii TaxID=1343680 RepID=UPI0038311394